MRDHPTKSLVPDRAQLNRMPPRHLSGEGLVSMDLCLAPPGHPGRPGSAEVVGSLRRGEPLTGKPDEPDHGM
jgi:hypothetical protein